MWVSAIMPLTKLACTRFHHTLGSQALQLQCPNAQQERVYEQSLSGMCRAQILFYERMLKTDGEYQRNPVKLEERRGMPFKE